MPSPKRESVADYFEQVPAAGAAHMAKLRELSLAADPELEEALHWNNPAYVKDGVRLWMLQSYKAHCSLRFPTGQFASHRAEVEEAGYEAGEGFIKLRYDQELPEDLCRRLIGYRLEEFAETGSKWTDK